MLKDDVGSGGGGFKREGIYVCLRQTHVVQQKGTKHCKAILVQLKHTHTHTHTHTQRQLQPLFSWLLQTGPSLSVCLSLSLFFFFFASSEPPFADLDSPSLCNQVLCLLLSYSFQIPTHLITAAPGSPPVPWKLI